VMFLWVSNAVSPSFRVIMSNFGAVESPAEQLPATDAHLRCTPAVSALTRIGNARLRLILETSTGQQ
jgi:hypothetical protein